MRRIGGSSALAVVANAQARTNLGLHRPKQDVHMGTFDINQEYHNWMARTGRIEDHTIKKIRKAYFRVDEMFRRAEHRARKEGFFFLPLLEYPIYRGLTPLFSARQLQLHYQKHHQAYITKLNQLIEGTPFYGMELDDLIRATVNDDQNKAIYNNAAQHFNHSFYWKGIQPGGSVIPPDLEAAVAEQYGSVEEFEKAFQAAALAHFGSGWVYWVYDDVAGKFDILSFSNADTPLTLDGVTPLLACDVWEHAYYQDYENDRAKYMSKFFSCVDYHWAERGWKRATGQEWVEMKYE